MKGFILSGPEQTLKKEQLLRRVGSGMGSGRFPCCIQNLSAKGSPPPVPQSSSEPRQRHLHRALTHCAEGFSHWSGVLLDSSAIREALGHH